MEIYVNQEMYGIIEGAVPQILAVERTLLNFIQRLSGVATKAAEFVDIVEQEELGCSILARRPRAFVYLKSLPPHVGFL